MRLACGYDTLNSILSHQSSEREMNAIDQYNHLSKAYTALAEIDPAKQYVQYPEALRLLGNLARKNILDIGCGNGTLTRMLVRGGARVVGYDPSIRQIEEAYRSEAQETLGITYYVGDRPAISPAFLFDHAVSVMVLPYAANQDGLRDIFTYARESLRDDGSFISITFNPHYACLGKVTCNRRFTRVADGKICVDFLSDDGQPIISATISDFRAVDYEQAARAAGFVGIEWITLQVASEGKARRGESYWRDFEADPPYIGIRVVKIPAAERQATTSGMD